MDDKSGPNSLTHYRVPISEVREGTGAIYYQACMKFCCNDGKLWKDNNQVTRPKPPSSWMNFNQELYETCMKLAYILSQTLPENGIGYLAVICERSQFTTDLSPQVFAVGYSIGEEFAKAMLTMVNKTKPAKDHRNTVKEAYKIYVKKHGDFELPQWGQD